jgi:aldehyde dehydrogenase (NAD+)
LSCFAGTVQRCTSTRRLIIHESVYETVKNAVVSAYGQLRR